MLLVIGTTTESWVQQVHCGALLAGLGMCHGVQGFTRFIFALDVTVALPEVVLLYAYFVGCLQEAFGTGKVVGKHYLYQIEWI